jgi:hypothetical protein
VEHTEYLGAISAAFREMMNAATEASQAESETESEELSLAVNTLIRERLARLTPPEGYEALHREALVLMVGPPGEQLTREEEVAWSRRLQLLLTAFHEHCRAANVEPPFPFHPSELWAGRRLDLSDGDGPVSAQ